MVNKIPFKTRFVITVSGESLQIDQSVLTEHSVELVLKEFIKTIHDIYNVEIKIEKERHVPANHH